MSRPELSPPDPEAYARQVWDIVRQVPHGKVATYGQVAARIPAPAGIDESEYAAFRARWVGSAMARSPHDVPWQRIINAQGKLSPRGGVDPTRQKELQEAEGVVFHANGKIDLKRFGWEQPA
ncbi:MAG TPA: MGMT family protein [Anaerolineaceae bacterium]|nr:MGMT family protein [Anaerolineaceae bacterium]